MSMGGICFRLQWNYDEYLQNWHINVRTRYSKVIDCLSVNTVNMKTNTHCLTTPPKRFFHRVFKSYGGFSQNALILLRLAFMCVHVNVSGCVMCIEYFLSWKSQEVQHDTQRESHYFLNQNFSTYLKFKYVYWIWKSFTVFMQTYDRDVHNLSVNLLLQKSVQFQLWKEQKKQDAKRWKIKSRNRCFSLEWNVFSLEIHPCLMFLFWPQKAFTYYKSKSLRCERWHLLWKSKR